MQKLKVCRKLMAFVLTLCMVLPLISNQYLVVRAEESTLDISECAEKAKVLSSDESYIVTEDDSDFITIKDSESIGNNTENGLLVKVTVPANKSAIFDVKDSLFGAINPMLIYSDLSQSPQRCQSSSYSFLNSSQEDEVYYVWLKKECVSGATITLYTKSNLSQYKEQAVGLTKDNPIEVKTNDDRYIEVITTAWGNNLTKTMGLLVSFEIPANGQATFNLKNTMSMKNFSVYEDLSQSPLTVNNSDSYDIKNETEQSKIYYVWIAQGQADGATISLIMPEYVSIDQMQKLENGKNNSLAIKDQIYSYTDDIGSTGELKGTLLRYTASGENKKMMDMTCSSTLSGQYTIRIFSKEDSDSLTYIDTVYLHQGMNNSYKTLSPQKTYIIEINAIGESNLEGLEFDIGDIVDLNSLNAREVTKAEQFSITSDQTQFVSDGLYGNAMRGAMFQVTLQEEHQIAITGVDVSAIHIYQKRNGSYVSIRTELDGAGKLSNGSDSEDNYYIFVEGESFTVGFSDITSMPIAVDIASVNAERLELDKPQQIALLTEQRVFYQTMPYGDVLSQFRKITGRVVKIEVPQDKVYKIDIDKDNELTGYKLSYDEKEQKYNENGITLYKGSPLCLSQGKYYFVFSNITDDSLVTICITEVDRFEDHKELAQEVSASDVQKESFVVNLFNYDGECAHSDGGKNANGFKSYVISKGGAIKFTVPAGKTWTFGRSDYYGGYIYYDDAEGFVNTLGNNTKVENPTNKDIDYYAWVDIPYDKESVTISIKESDCSATLEQLKDKAVKLSEDKLVNGVYDKVQMDEQFTAVIPMQYDYQSDWGRLYEVDVPSYYKLDIVPNKNTWSDARFLAFTNLAKPSVTRGSDVIELYNFSNNTKTYYIWITEYLDCKITDLTLTSSSLDKQVKTNADGKKVVETTIKNADADIVVEENLNAASSIIDSASVAVVSGSGKIENDALVKSIDVVEQYNAEDTKMQKVSNIQTSVTDSQNATLNKAVIQSIKDANSDITVEVGKSEKGREIYCWRFESDSVKKSESVVDVNTNINIIEDVNEYKDAQKLDTLPKEAKKCVLSFEHDGDLPGTTKVTVDADQYIDNATLYYYHVNGDTLDLVGETKVVDGYATIEISHCSDYVLSDNNVCVHLNTKVEKAK